MMMHKIKDTLATNTPWVILLVGPPLSGKTTFLRNEMAEFDYETISRDDIVLELFGRDDYNTAFKEVNQKKVDQILKSKLEGLSKSGKNVVIDMTNMTRKRRASNLSYFPNYYKVSIIFPILEFSEYEIRNKKRTEEEKKTIPMFVIKNMISSYQTISKIEGFDKVFSIN